MSDVEFVDGLMVKKPHSNAPDFVKGSLSIKREDLIKWLQQKQGEWINIDLKESKKGSWYAQVNDWQPSGGGQGASGQSAPQSIPPQNDPNRPLPQEPPTIDDDFDIGKVPF